MFFKLGKTKQNTYTLCMYINVLQITPEVVFKKRKFRFSKLVLLKSKPRDIKVPKLEETSKMQYDIKNAGCVRL